MTIEELASASEQSKYTLKSERTYNNIRQMRNSILMKGFLQHKTDTVVKKTTIISGIEYVNLTNFKNINSTWLYLSRIPKNIIWIVNKGGVKESEIKAITKDLGIKIKQIFIIEPNMEEVRQNCEIASSIATIDDCVVFSSFDENIIIRNNLSISFDNYITNM